MKYFYEFIVLLSKAITSYHLCDQERFKATIRIGSFKLPLNLYSTRLSGTAIDV